VDLPISDRLAKPEKVAFRGVDSFQALILALQTIGAEIYASAYHKAGSLKWAERYRGYGFPVGGNLRDLLIGDDTNL
jgi:hypothetical protein